MIRGTLLAAGLALALLGCSKPAPPVLNFSIASAEDQQSMEKVWGPLLSDLNKQTGLNVQAHYAGNYTAQIEAMKFNQVQLGWFPALSTLQAVRRADGEVLGRITGANGQGMAYASVLLVKKGSEARRRASSPRPGPLSSTARPASSPSSKGIPVSDCLAV